MLEGSGRRLENVPDRRWQAGRSFRAATAPSAKPLGARCHDGANGGTRHTSGQKGGDGTEVATSRRGQCNTVAYPAETEADYASPGAADWHVPALKTVVGGPRVF
jgi:hypothetical protein